MLKYEVHFVDGLRALKPSTKSQKGLNKKSDKAPSNARNRPSWRPRVLGKKNFPKKKSARGPGGGGGAGGGGVGGALFGRRAGRCPTRAGPAIGKIFSPKIMGCPGMAGAKIKFIGPANCGPGSAA